MVYRIFSFYIYSFNVFACSYFIGKDFRNSFIQKYDNLSNSLEKIIKIYRRVWMKNVLIQVFPWKKKRFCKKSRLRDSNPWPLDYKSSVLPLGYELWYRETVVDIIWTKCWNQPTLSKRGNRRFKINIKRLKAPSNYLKLVNSVVNRSTRRYTWKWYTKCLGAYVNRLTTHRQWILKLTTRNPQDKSSIFSWHVAFYP